MPDTSSPTFTVGQIIPFKGYSDDTMTDDMKLFQPGQRVRIEKINADGGMTAVPVGDNDEPLTNVPGDTVFPEELEGGDALMQEAAEAGAAEQATEAPKAGKSAGKGAKAGKAAPAKTEAPKAGKSAKGAKAAPIKPTAASRRAAEDAAGALVGAEAVDGPDESMSEENAREDAAAQVGSQAVAERVIAPAATEGHLVNSERVSRLLAEQDALEAADALVDQVESAYFTLGGVLNHIYDNGVHRAAGFDGKRGFANYVQGRLGIQYRKAMYLIDIYRAFRLLGVDESRLAEIGWSKAKELTKIATPENFDALVDLAKSKTRDQLVAHIQKEYVGTGDGEGNKVQKTKLNFSLFADQTGTVTRALDAAKGQVGNDDPNQALEYICAEWLNMSEGVEVPLEQAIAHIAAKYGVRVQATAANGDVMADTSEVGSAEGAVLADGEEAEQETQAAE